MHHNEAIVRKFIDEAFNGGRLEAIDAMLSPDFVEHQALGPGAPTGRDAPRAIVSSLRRGFSDFHLDVEDVASQGDTVWLRLRGTGTHDGPFMGRAPTGKPMAITVIDVMRVRDGKIVEHWGVADRLAALAQLDA
jgi:predicted ester cyclase